MTICREHVEQYLNGFCLGYSVCDTKMIFSLERRTWYCPECGNSVRVPKEQQSLNEYTRKS